MPINELTLNPLRRLRQSMSLGPIYWTPANDPMLLRYYRSDLTSSIRDVGGLVSRWDDQSGNDEHAVQPTGANQPTTDSRTLDGKNQLDFISNDFMYSQLTIPASGNIAFWIVANADSISSDAEAMISYNSATNFFELEANDPTDFKARLRYSTEANIVPSSAYNGPSIYGCIFDFVGGQKYLRIDGSSIGSNGHTKKLSNDGAQRLHIMVDKAGNSTIDGGCAVVAVTEDVDIDTSYLYEGSLAWAWGLEGNLSTFHPYKKNPPMI